MKELEEAIKNTFQLSEEVINEFVSCWEKVSFQKKSILSELDKTDRYIYFTITGIQKAYYLIESKENIISFTQPNNFTCVPESFLTQTPSKYYFQCITESEFYRLSYKDFSHQIKKHPEILEFLFAALMGLVNNTNERFKKRTTFTIEQKFENFMNSDAHLINLIPHKDIANYLSMNPTNFSKLLNKVRVE